MVTSPPSLTPRSFMRLALVAGLGVLVANCASKQAGKHVTSREIGAFSDPKYGAASPRVVDLDATVPKGGGRYQVGKAYSIAGKTYFPREKPTGYTATGLASWYGIAFHGRKTANGEVYDRNSISAAHPTMPLPSYARVTNLANNQSLIVRVNDRGPYHGNRVMDLSEKAAQLLQYKHMGTAKVKIDYLGPASLMGSDDTKLIATLAPNGGARLPANTVPVNTAPVQVASANSRFIPAVLANFAGETPMEATATDMPPSAEETAPASPALALVAAPIPPVRPAFPAELRDAPAVKTPAESTQLALLPPTRGVLYAAPTHPAFASPVRATTLVPLRPPPQ